MSSKDTAISYFVQRISLVFIFSCSCSNVCIFLLFSFSIQLANRITVCALSVLSVNSCCLCISFLIIESEMRDDDVWPLTCLSVAITPVLGRFVRFLDAFAPDLEIGLSSSPEYLDTALPPPAPASLSPTSRCPRQLLPISITTHSNESARSLYI